MKKSIQIEVAGSTFDILGGVIKAIIDIKAIAKDPSAPAEKSVEVAMALVKDLSSVVPELQEVAAESLQDDLAAVLAQAPALIAALKS